MGLAIAVSYNYENDNHKGISLITSPNRKSYLTKKAHTHALDHDININGILCIFRIVRGLLILSKKEQ